MMEFVLLLIAVILYYTAYRFYELLSLIVSRKSYSDLRCLAEIIREAENSTDPVLKELSEWAKQDVKKFLKKQ